MLPSYLSTTDPLAISTEERSSLVASACGHAGVWALKFPNKQHKIAAFQAPVLLPPQDVLVWFNLFLFFTSGKGFLSDQFTPTTISCF